MASFTLDASGTFPTGTNVGAYPDTGWIDTLATPSSGPPPVAAVETHAVANDQVAFTALTTGQHYVAGADIGGGNWRYVRFQLAAQSAGAGTGNALAFTDDNYTATLTFDVTGPTRGKLLYENDANSREF